MCYVLRRWCRLPAVQKAEGVGPLVAAPLYASLPPSQQLRVFDPAPPGTRKVRSALCRTPRSAHTARPSGGPMHLVIALQASLYQRCP